MSKALFVFSLLALPVAFSFAGDASRETTPFFPDTSVRREGANAAAPASEIRVDVDMALVPVTVLDRNGRNVLGLQPDNFKVFDGSKLVNIAAFSRQDAPISLGIIFDFSESMKDKYVIAREAPAELFRQLDPRDEGFLITVSDHPELRFPFTSDFGELQNALLFGKPKGSTSLLDGVYFGLSELKKARNSRKVLVVVSDGGDNNSRYSLRQTLAAAAESDTQIFAIGLYTNPQTPEETDGPRVLSQLCDKTGGVAFPIAAVGQMAGAMAKLGEALHNQYLLGYYPPEDQQTGKFRKIKVELQLPNGSPRLNIYARSGYYAR